MRSSGESPENLQPRDLVPALHDALRALAHPRDLQEVPSLAALLPNLLPASPVSQATIRALLEKGLERMQPHHPDLATLLRARFWEGRTVQALALERSRSLSGLYARQAEGLAALAEVLWQMEREEAARHGDALSCLRRNLPAATYTRLFGVTGMLRRLQSWLEDAGGPLLISVEGVGGLGKTALARAAVETALRAGSWADLAWVSVADHALHPWRERSDTAPLDPEGVLEQIAWQLGLEEVAVLAPTRRRAALQARLTRQPHLVVIDDLEPAHEPAELAANLMSFGGPTRFLLTTRQRLPDLPGGANLPLRELPRRASVALLRHEAALRGLPEFENSLLEQIHAVVGGSPLALKLVLGQAAALPLERVLENLQTPEGVAAQDLFRRIYRQSWGLLTSQAQEVLLSMALFSSRGATYSELQEATDLPGAQLDGALGQLVTHSLLAFDPTPPGRYAVHRLTHTFLLSRIFASDEEGA